MAKQQPNQQRNRPAPSRPNPVKQAVQAMGDLQLPEFFLNHQLQSFLLMALACFVYIGSLGHQFVSDDAIVITDNMFTQKGLAGINGILSNDTFFGFFKVEGKDLLVSGGRYRPFTLVIFAILYQFVGPNPFIFHLVTVLLYGVTCLVMYRTLLLMLGKEFGENYASITAWIATALFAVHPIHTEVVANIKGCDEIVTLLGSLGTLWLALKAFDTGKAMYAWISAVVFFFACMSKENAVTYLAVIPLALWMFRRADLPKIAGIVGPAFLGFLVFFVIRGSILKWHFGGAPLELMNNPFVKLDAQGNWAFFSAGEKLATIIYTLGKYIMLLFAPVNLTHDYYPRHIAMMKFSDPGVLLSLAVYIGLAVYAVRNLRSRSIIAFGILYYLLTLSIVSNLVFPVGTNMGERFAFMPSVGFCLIISVLLVNLMKSGNGWAAGKLTTVLAIAGIAGAAFAVKTFMRVPAWQTNENLFFTDVTNSPNSAKIRNACGGVLFDKARLETDETKRKEYCQQALPHLNKAIEIYRDYADAYISRGGANLLLGNFEQSVADYNMVAKLQPNNPKTSNMLSTAYRETGKNYGEKKGDLVNAMKNLNLAWQYDNTDVETARLLGVANGMGQNHAEALKWFTKAVELEPSNASNLFDLGTAYMMSGDKAKADEMYAKAQQLDPQILQKKGRR